jgi:hypothetical protein
MYQRGKVYAIICRKTDRRYIGSTCEPTIAKRLAKHVTSFKCWKEGMTRCMSYDIIKDGDYHIVLLELYPCNSRDELRMCEQKHIDSCECLNKRKAFRSDEELAEYNKEYMKEYYEKHKDELAESAKEYRKQHKEEIAEQKKEYHQSHKKQIAERQKIYREEHKEEIAEKAKIYRNEHKEQLAGKKKEYHQSHKKERAEYLKQHKKEIAEYKKQRVCCPTCQKEVGKNNFSRHKKICVKI